MGWTNPVSVMAQCSLGVVCRRLQSYDEGSKLLHDNFAARQRKYTMQADITVDSGLQLALLLRETSEIAEAEGVLETIEPAALAGKMKERLHQLEHIRALLQVDLGDVEAACDTLLKVVSRTRIDTRSSL